MGQDPLVTVLLPVYNSGSYLRLALGSILEQTYRNLEVLVIDDGSTDGSPDVVGSFHDSRIRLVRNERNLGLIATLNRGLELAQGELIARMDGDDISLPERIERQVRRFAEDAELGVLGTDVYYIDSDGTRLGRPRFAVVGPELIRWRLLRGNCINHPTVMMRRSVLGKALRYADRYIHAEDYDLWLRCSLVSKLDNLPEPLLLYRQHGGSVSKKHESAQLHAATLALQEHLRGSYGLEPPFGQLMALIQPRAPLDDGQGEGSPMRLIIELKNAHLAKFEGIPAKERREVERDVALFLWKGMASAVSDLSTKSRWITQGIRGLLSMPGCAGSALFRAAGAQLAGTTSWR